MVFLSPLLFLLCDVFSALTHCLLVNTEERKEREACAVTQTEGADVDTAAADAGHAANGEEEEGLGEDGRHQAARRVHAQARQQHGALAVPAQTKKTTQE